MKILIFGSSVGLNIRPPRANRSEKNYAMLLHEMLSKLNGKFVVYNKCVWHGMITDYNSEEFSNIILQEDPEIIILNYGVNECAPRLLSKKIWYYLNNPGNKNNTIIRFINRFFYHISPRMIKILKLNGWVKIDDFEINLKEKIGLIEKETKSDIILLGIGITNHRVESRLPGINKLIQQYNNAMSNISSMSNRCFYLDLSNLTDYMPDGIHFDFIGHQTVAKKIYNIISERMQN